MENYIIVYCVVGVIVMVLQATMSVLSFKNSSKQTERYLQLNPPLEPIVEYINQHKSALDEIYDNLDEIKQDISDLKLSQSFEIHYKENK